MHKFSKSSFLAALPLLLLGSLAHAQTAGTITFTANKTSATGSLVPVLTWSTSPVATSCVASGAWSGNKFASGSETLPSITSNKSYTLTCSWGGGTATIKWTAPTANSDGSPLTDLAGYKVLFGTSSGSLTKTQTISDPKATSATIAALASGTWYFAVRSVNSKQVESDNSNVAQKTITAATAAKSVAITINPGSGTLKTVVKGVYDVVTVNGVRTLGVYEGDIALGAPCDSTYKVPKIAFYKVSSSLVKIHTTPRSSTLVARCAIS